MDLGVFLQQRRPDWRRLEEMLSQVEGSGLRGLDPEKAVEFGNLYRRTASDLNQAQTFVSGDEVISYLNQLVARCYVVIYGSRSKLRLWSAIKAGFVGYARVLRKEMRYCLLATLLFALGIGLGLTLTLTDPVFLEYMIPPEFNTVRPAESEADDEMPHASVGQTTEFAGRLFQNNTKVTLFAFALGLTFGVGTCWLLFYNGLLTGALMTLFWEAGQMTRFAADILPHGVVEIPAILIGGAAGLILARGMIAARPWPRLDEMASAGRDAVKLVMGAVPLLIAAALIEAAVARAPRWVLGDWAKLTWAGVVGLFFVLYAVFIGRTHGQDSLSSDL